MKCFRILLLLVIPALLPAQNLGKLPGWAADVAKASLAEVPPGDADAWVLLDRSEVAYTGSGEIQFRRLQLTRILTESGINRGMFRLNGLGGAATKVKKVKGWNLRPDGELLKLDSDTVVSLDTGGDEDGSLEFATAAALPQVVKGSYVAFESVHVIKHPMGPQESGWVLRGDPIRRWEFEAAKKEGFFTNLKQVEVKFDLVNFQTWIPKVEGAGTLAVAANHVPPMPKDELASGSFRDFLPRVHVRFLDPEVPLSPTGKDWDALARWTEVAYRNASSPTGLTGSKGLPTLEGLRKVRDWMGRELTYKAIYMTPARGWTPELSPEVGRRRYGDCKDVAAFFGGEASAMGLKAYPALARISGGMVTREEPPSLSFDHMITALKLPTSLGLASEVQTPEGRFLLVDPTDRFVPLGMLPSAHRGGNLMICAEGKGIWVQAPEACILSDQIDIQLEGAIDAGGKLECDLRIEEGGNAWGLRNTMNSRGAKALVDVILRNHMDLPTNAVLTLKAQSDPLDASAPFRMDLHLTHPRALVVQGESRLDSLGLLKTPIQIQKFGVSRQTPVRGGHGPRVTFKATLKTPRKLEPVLQPLQATTAFRKLTFQAQASESKEGALLTLTWESDPIRTTFSAPRLEEGVKAWKQDRSLVRKVLDEGFLFR